MGFAPGSVVVNEIMYAPLGEEPEWVEVMNLGGESVDLQRWRLSDANPASAAEVKQGVVLPPEGLLVLAQDSAIVRAFQIDPKALAVVTPWPSLNNDADEITLYDPLGQVIDRVPYRASWGGDRGISLEKINPDIPGRDSTNWASSAAPEGATPGRRNSVFARVLPSETTLTISPDVFSPDGDGRDDLAVIQYDLPLSTATVNIKIYDMRGRLVRYLANNRPAGAHNSIVWDGRDERGEVAGMGLYVVFLQALNAQAGVLTTQKKTVVVAGGL
ncbi:MAG: hypothetical protein D6743_02940 [Calditrichaeota bacterium]|nr:MAG: hypothetical protein D6743_02940 [Calditrichota bacterium]